MINHNHQAQVQYVQEAHTTQKNYEKKEGGIEINYTIDNKVAGQIANSNNINKIFNTKNNNLTVNIPEKLMNEYSLKTISVNGKEYGAYNNALHYDGQEVTLSNCKAFNPKGKNIVTVNFANKKVVKSKNNNSVVSKSKQNSEVSNVQVPKKLSVKLSYKIDNGVNNPIKMTEQNLQTMENAYIGDREPELYIELPQQLLNQNILESVTVNGHNYTTKDGLASDGPNVLVLSCFAYKNDGANTITVNLKKPNFKEITSVKSGSYLVNPNGQEVEYRNSILDGQEVQYTNYTLPGKSQVYLDKAYPYYYSPYQMYWGKLNGYKLQVSPQLLEKYKVQSLTINGVEVPASSLAINEKTGTITMKSNPNNAQALNGFAFQQIVNFANKEGKVLVNKTQPKVESTTLSNKNTALNNESPTLNNKNTALNNESTTKKLSSIVVEPQSKQVAQTTVDEAQNVQISSLPNTGISSGNHSEKTVGAGIGLLIFLAAVGGVIGFKKRR